VGSEHKLVLPRQGVELAEIVEYLDVGVEVGDRLAFGEQPSQQPGLHRRGKLHQVVARRHPLEGVEVEVGRGADLERLRRGIEVAVDLVDDEHAHSPLRVLAVEGLAQHAGLGEIVLRDDRADVHFRTLP
jgi:hypothetical protein